MTNASPLRVLYIEASMGGVTGGSLTGLQHFLRGLDRRRYRPAVVLYEEKALEGELTASGVPLRIFRKRQRGRSHPLQQVEVYKQLRRHRLIRDPLHAMRAFRIFVQ
ncbi:MAG TPA: hypothetical protein VNO43_01755, partial [Candidatus Eisenbacteria bacterium]|nr:hypothetical protein [Candidatus Eisenbacteria bacterium]